MKPKTKPLSKLMIEAVPAKSASKTLDFIANERPIICAPFVRKYFPNVNLDLPINITLSKRRLKGGVSISLWFTKLADKYYPVYLMSHERDEVSASQWRSTWREMWNGMKDTLTTFFSKELELTSQKEFIVYCKVENISEV